jgi:hypothetical protein
MACLATNAAGLYGDCKSHPCQLKYDCIKGTAAAVCLLTCKTDSECASAESCTAVTSSGVSYCLPQCKSDTDCPPLLRCTGFGPWPYNHCTPTTPGAVGSVCTSSSGCKAGTRCVGIKGQTNYCYKACPTGVSCASDQLCVKLDNSDNCLASCSPLDSPVKCATYEVCYADPKLKQAYCFPAKGDATTCTSAIPCVSGKVCVDGKCLLACDATHKCPSGKTCTALVYNGKSIPWKACK